MSTSIKPIWENFTNHYSECWKKVDRKNFISEDKLHQWHINSPIKIQNEPNY